ncbi:tRNA-specific 2-thiouridylase MnmA [bacterium HR23]|nr:tRNA-specific 2-thiouridylase MnmA [bacterium HR23]
MAVSQKRVIVAMSGGVDSSVCALLLKEAGYQVVGVTLRLFTLYRPTAAPLHRSCCSLEDVDDARRVCHALGIPHYVVNAEREFRTFVIGYFVQEYRRGRTPNPCIACNDRIKFEFLLRRALAWGADYIATGHYARVVERNNRYSLLKGGDEAKDQSYVLFGLGQEQLRRLLLPIGWYSKAQVRAMAEQAGLPVARKPDSQEICFVLSGDYRAFLRQQGGGRPGEVVDLQGKVLGRHNGVEFFTVGQRRGLGVANHQPMYVVAIDAPTARVIVGPEEALYQDGLVAEGVNWVEGAPDGPAQVQVKVRYRAPAVDATVVPTGPHTAYVRFHQPQRAITPGQAVVFYEGDRVLGGGFIAGPQANDTSAARAPQERVAGVG